VNDRSPEEEPEEEREAEEGAGRDEEDLEEEFSKLSPEERERLARQAQELAKKLAPFREQMGRQVSKIVMESSGFARLLEEMNRRNAEILGGPAARIAKDLVGQQQAISEAIERAYRPTLGVDRLLDGAIIKPAWDQIDEEYDSEEEREERKREYVRTAFDVNAEADDTIDEQAKEAVEEFEGQPPEVRQQATEDVQRAQGESIIFFLKESMAIQQTQLDESRRRHLVEQERANAAEEAQRAAEKRQNCANWIAGGSLIVAVLSLGAAIVFGILTLS